MTTGGAIDPAGIPHFTGNLDEVENSATGVHTAAKELAEHGHGVHSTFQGLSAYYQAPEAEKLFSSTHTIPAEADALKGELFTVSTALEDYATAVRPIVRRIEHIRAQAVTFAASVEGDDDWHKDADKVSRNSGLRSDLAAALEDFATAQNDCANKISALVGGHHYMLNPTGDQALVPKNAAFNGYSADAWEHAEQTPWGSPVEREYEGVEWLLHQTKSLVWDGFVIRGFVGTLDGLSTLVGAKGWDQAGQAWKGLGDAVGGLSQYLMTPYDWVLDHTLGPDQESAGEKRQKEAFKNFAKGFVAYDDWKENPARAAGTFGFNALTLAAGAGGGAAVRGGTGARVVAGLGKAGRFVDPMTYLGKAGSFSVVKVGDAFTALKNLHSTPTTLHLADGGSFTAHEAGAGLPERPAAIPQDAIPGTDELGRTVYLDTETGHLLNADGTIHQHANDATRELPTEQRATAHSDMTTPARAAREPELVGAHAGANSVDAVGHASEHAAAGAARGLPGPAGEHLAGHHGGDATTGRPGSGGDGSGYGGAGDEGGASGQSGDEGLPRERASGQNPYEGLALKEIQAEQVRRANHEAGYFDEYYKENGYRKDVDLPDESGFAPPQLVKDPNNPGTWISKDDTPPAHPAKYVAGGDVKRGVDTVPTQQGLDELVKAAHERHTSVTADNVWHKPLGDAKQAWKAAPTPENLAAYEQVKAQHAPVHERMTTSSEQFGQTIAREHVMPELYPGATRIEDLGGPRNGNDQLDDVYRLSDGETYVAIEEKSTVDTQLGERTLPDGFAARQGSREYLDDILKHMLKRGINGDVKELKLYSELRKAWNEGKLQYILVKGRVDDAGNYIGYYKRQFDIG